MLSSRITFDPLTDAGPHKILGNSDRRVYLCLFPPSSGSATLSNSPTVSDGSGITLLPGMSPIRLSVGQDGSVVQMEWYVVYTGTVRPVAWIEAMV